MREDLNKRAERRMAVLRPLKLIVEKADELKVDISCLPNEMKDSVAASVA